MCTYTITYNPCFAEGKGKEEAKFDFTSEGEGYISLNAAIVNARRLVRQDEQRCLNRTGWVGIVWSTRARGTSRRVRNRMC